MRVALVNPPQTYLVDPLAYPPSGLMYLQAAIREQCGDIAVDVLNFAALDWWAVVEQLRRYDVVGYTANSCTWYGVVALARAVQCDGVRQIVGGVHPTVMDVDAPVFDAVFKGAAESTLADYLLAIQEGTPTKKVYESTVDAFGMLPIPEPCIGKRLNVGGGDRTAVVFTSRGCSHKCAFCCIQHVNKRLRMRSIDRVVQELEQVRRAGIEDVRFMDDSFSAYKRRATELCSRIKPLGLRWGCTVRVTQVDAEVLEAMREAGCTEVGFGIESFDDSVLLALNKRATAAQNEAAVELAASVGLKAHLFMMISTPGESIATPHWNIAALERLKDKFHRVLLSTLMPYPGSPIWSNPERYHVRMLTWDFARFNQYTYRRQGDVVVEAGAWSPLEIDGLPVGVQLDNIRKMREYIAGLRQANKGRFD